MQIMKFFPISLFLLLAPVLISSLKAIHNHFNSVWNKFAFLIKTKAKQQKTERWLKQFFYFNFVNFLFRNIFFLWVCYLLNESIEWKRNEMIVRWLILTLNYDNTRFIITKFSYLFGSQKWQKKDTKQN